MPDRETLAALARDAIQLYAMDATFLIDWARLLLASWNPATSKRNFRFDCGLWRVQPLSGDGVVVGV
jgi:hypothetical protein